MRILKEIQALGHRTAGTELNCPNGWPTGMYCLMFACMCIVACTNPCAHACGGQMPASCVILQVQSTQELGKADWLVSLRGTLSPPSKFRVSRPCHQIQLLHVSSKDRVRVSMFVRWRFTNLTISSAPFSLFRGVHQQIKARSSGTREMTRWVKLPMTKSV